MYIIERQVLSVSLLAGENKDQGAGMKDEVSLDALYLRPGDLHDDS